MLQQVLQNDPHNQFVYCTPSDEQESFSLYFWTNPLDGWSWTFLGICVVLLAIVLKGKLFAIFAVLMRQDCYILKEHRFFIIFILVSIVITCGYEGIISSFLTVPPPVVVFNSLKELIDHGYKIIGYSANVETFELKTIFQSENITSQNLTSSLVPETYYVDDQVHVEMLAKSNVTRSFGISSLSFWKSEMEKNYPKIRCHHAKNTFIQTNVIHTFHGHFHLQLFQAFNRIREAGITSFYLNFLNFYRKFTANRGIELHDYELRQPSAFMLGDWKILSVFCVWASLMCVSLLVVLLEIIHRFTCLSPIIPVVLAKKGFPK
jgi:hypothetical protein